MRRFTVYICLFALTLAVSSCATRKRGKGKGCDCPGFGQVEKPVDATRTDTINVV